MRLNPLSHEIVFRRPARLSQAPNVSEHLPFMMLLVELVQPRLFVEIGTYFGDSYCSVCQAVSELGLATKCYGVHSQEQVRRTDFGSRQLFEDLKEYHDPQYSKFSNILEMTSDDASQKFSEGEIDLLHIDGFQDTEDIEHDLETWLPKMSHRGIVLFYGTVQRESGVSKVWKELSGRYPNFGFEHGNGLGMVAVGSEIPLEVEPLLNATEEEVLIIREFFGAIGRRWSLESSHRKALIETSRLQDFIVSLADTFVQPEEEIVEKRFDHPYGLDAAEDISGYQVWREKSIQEFLARRETLVKDLRSIREVPMISILVAVSKPSLGNFQQCVDSVFNQVWPEWELCICYDASLDPELDRYLQRLSASDHRIRIGRNNTSLGLPEATNVALQLASGQFIAFLDQHNVLDPHAIAEIAIALARDPEIDVLYTDEDQIDTAGNHSSPWFKPDWSPDLLMSWDYINQGLAVKKSAVEELGGLRSEFGEGARYDLMLRATENVRRVHHLPMVLYHCRGDTRSRGLELADRDASRRALQSALDRRGEGGTVEDGLLTWAFRPRFPIKADPLVTIVIPFREGADLLRRCVDSIESLAGYQRWEGLFVDNQSREPETHALIAQLSRNPHVRVLSYSEEFNWSELNNWAARQAQGEYLLFLNNDIEAISDGWLVAMLEQAQRDEVGVVGARLIYPDGRVQHAGVIMGMSRICAHAFWFCPPERDAYFGMDKLLRNCSAVTGACMMVRKKVFDELGGFDEDLRVAYNDIDFCLRARERGYLVVYTPHAELVHFEAATRGISSEILEEKLMLVRWRDWLERGDPYYNPNLGLRRFDFGLPYESETPPWKDLLSELEN